jgi:hypothetical protein
LPLPRLPIWQFLTPLFAVLSLPLEGVGFVRLHQAAIASHIGSEDCGKPTLDLYLNYRERASTSQLHT